ncbi:hypothetical protein FEM48_Zijuj01G0307400 [Ziziphus jujuba var. spinosa]|uniref:SNRNP25 ubiquitin-like domain-containing protein n=1 Tax=Ziziphus jujuba var. spinosa TaxID=714518 RepID=A0A978W631_ZIZJJ|nr:hypothetical protein FEM48_Zijuj01G0307400 [Ziziphus jujuba var. spinosa]
MRLRSNSNQEERHSSSTSRSRGTKNLRVLIERRFLAPLTLNDNVGDGNVRNYSSYQKLPQLHLLKLSVLKLDGSAFEVLVARNATISELKQAIEEVFTSVSKEEGHGIAWSLVWGHFCLCYEGHKLINDKSYIRNYGIKEGDQLQFIRHMCINFSPLEKRSEKESTVFWKKQSVLTDKENTNIDGEQEENFVQAQFKMPQFVRGWLSYSRLWGGLKKGIRLQESSYEIGPAWLRNIG